MENRILSATDEWKRGWKLAIACFIGFSFFSIMSSSLGVFMAPLSAEFGWSRTLLSSGIAVAAVAVMILSPFFGILIDRYGSRKVAMPGIVAAAIAISSFGFANGSTTQWILLWGVYAVVSISVKTTVWTAAIVGSFKAAQGMALGVILTGGATAQAVIPPLANWLIDELGWRMAYVALGCGWGGFTLLLCYFFLHDAHSRKPAGTTAETRRRERLDLPGLTISQAWRDLALWRIGISTLLVMLLTIGLLIHQVPILIAAGVPKANAAWLASLAGIAGITGKLASGFLLDYFRPNWVGGLTLFATALTFLLLLEGARTPVLIVCAMIVSGYSAGSNLQIVSYLTARYGGLRNFGLIYGVITSLVAFGSGVGPMVAGFVYDMTHAYTAFLFAGAIGCVLCGILLMTLPAYPRWEAAPAGPDNG